MNLSNKPNLKALKELLEEVGQLNLFYKIVGSSSKEAVKSNVAYAIKEVDGQAQSLGYKGIEADLRKYVAQISDPQIKAEAEALVNALFENDTNDVIDRMTAAFFNRQKNYIPTMRKPGQKSKVKKHRRFNFSQMTAKALRRA